MDRRDALKKLGMGGATVVGASMVISSPALANPGTPTCARTEPGTPAVTAAQTSGNGGQGTAAITISFANLGTINSCPCTGTPTLSGPPSAWVVNSVAGSPTSGNASSWTNLGNGTFNYSFQLRVRCLDQGGLAVCSVWSGGGTVTVNGQSALGFTQPTTASFVYSDTACV